MKKDKDTTMSQTKKLKRTFSPDVDNSNLSNTRDLIYEQNNHHEHYMKVDTVLSNSSSYKQPKQSKQLTKSAFTNPVKLEENVLHRDRPFI